MDCRTDKEKIQEAVDAYNAGLSASSLEISTLIAEALLDKSPEYQKEGIKEDLKQLIRLLALIGVTDSNKLADKLGTPNYNEQERLRSAGLALVGGVVWPLKKGSNVSQLRTLYNVLSRDIVKLTKALDKNYGTYFITVSKTKTTPFPSSTGVYHTQAEVNSLAGRVLSPEEYVQEDIDGTKVTYLLEEELLGVNISLEKAVQISGIAKEGLNLRIFKVGTGDFSIFYSNQFKKLGLNNDQISRVFGVGSINPTIVKKELNNLITKTTSKGDINLTYQELDSGVRRIISILVIKLHSLEDDRIYEKLLNKNTDDEVRDYLLTQYHVESIDIDADRDAIFQLVSKSIRVPIGTYYTSNWLLSKNYDALGDFTREMKKFLSVIQLKPGLSYIESRANLLLEMFTENEAYIVGTSSISIREKDETGISSRAKSLDAPYVILGRFMDTARTFSLDTLIKSIEEGLGGQYPKTLAVVTMIKNTLLAALKLTKDYNTTTGPLIQDIEHYGSIALNALSLPIDFTEANKSLLLSIQKKLNSIIDYYVKATKEINEKLKQTIMCDLNSMLEFLTNSPNLDEATQKELASLKSVNEVVSTMQDQTQSQNLGLKLEIQKEGCDTSFLSDFLE